jgi:putative flippase GtrA
LSRIISLAQANSKEFTRFVKFGTVGTVGAVIDFAVLNLMFKAFHWSLLASNTLSFSCAVFSNFTWNRLWTFPESRERPFHTQLVQFTVVNLVGLAINNGVLLLARSLLSQFIPDPFDYNLAKAIAIGVVLFWNFGVNRIWTYRGL